MKGAQAQLSKDDRQPHLAESDAQALLANAVSAYRKEHRTMPARLVVHKTSKMTEGEIRGFRAASEESKVDAVELLRLRRSFTRLFRVGTYPPLRGTFLNLQSRTGILYLRGSQQRDFFVVSVLSFGRFFPGRDSLLFEGLSSAIEH